MSPASGDTLTEPLPSVEYVGCFHSINVPSEWGLETTQERYDYCWAVSIQLMSPASGDNTTKNKTILTKVLSSDLLVSIQLMSPASGD